MTWVGGAEEGEIYYCLDGESPSIKTSGNCLELLLFLFSVSEHYSTLLKTHCVSVSLKFCPMRFVFIYILKCFPNGTSTLPLRMFMWWLATTLSEWQWKLYHDWCSPTDTSNLSSNIVASLRIYCSRNHSSHEIFFVWKICSWTDLFMATKVQLYLPFNSGTEKRNKKRSGGWKILHGYFWVTLL